ncbi:MAG: hypothetical protein EHM56_13465, partial [Chloroflexi bacterium]
MHARVDPNGYQQSTPHNPNLFSPSAFEDFDPSRCGRHGQENPFLIHHGSLAKGLREQAEARLKALVPNEFGFAVVDRSAPGRVCHALAEEREFVTRFGAQVTGKQGWTDVAQFTGAGVPAFNFGPGVP